MGPLRILTCPSDIKWTHLGLRLAPWTEMVGRSWWAPELSWFLSDMKGLHQAEKRSLISELCFSVLRGPLRPEMSPFRPILGFRPDFLFCKFGPLQKIVG